MPDYVKNADLTGEIIKCQQTMRVSETLCKMLLMMIERIAQRPNWRNYSYLADMKSEALVQLIKCNDPKRCCVTDPRPNVLKFSMAYSERAGVAPNPFAYVTTIIINAFRRQIKLEAALQDFRDDGLIAGGVSPSARRQFEDEQNKWSEPIPKRIRRSVGRPK